MTLTTDEMRDLWLEVMLEGRVSRLSGEEADDFRKSIKKEKVEADKKGISLEMPFEW